MPRYCFYEKIANRILQVSSALNENRKQWLWKLTNCTLKSILLTKTMNKVFFDSNDYKNLTDSISFLRTLIIDDKYIYESVASFQICKFSNYFANFILFLCAGHPPVRVICWFFFLLLAKINRCGKSAVEVNGQKVRIKFTFEYAPIFFLTLLVYKNPFKRITRILFENK